MTSSARARQLRIGRIATRLLSLAVGALVMLFLLVPVVLVIIFSFSPDAFVHFPPRTWGFGNYTGMVNEEPWLHATGQSFLIGFAAAGLALLVAIPALMAIHRSRLPGRSALESISLGALIIPVTAYAVALYGVYVDVGLLGSKYGIILIHAMLGLPLILIIAGGSMRAIPRELELASMSLGAGRLRTWSRITFRLMIFGLLAGFILAFLQSFDEVVFVIFLSGPGFTTLPKAIFDSLRFGISPIPTAISVALMIFFSLALATAAVLRGTKGTAFDATTDGDKATE
jgi:ABC-type spermidine/putrescine transport system permease subunit II